MAKRKGTADSGSNDKSSTKAADVAASNKQVLEQLNEISNQSANFFNVAREAALKFIGTAGELSNVLSEQCEKVKCFEAMSKSLESAEESSKQFTAVISKQAIAVKKLAENAGFKKSGSGYAAKNNVFEQLSESSKRAKIGVLALGGAIKLLGAGFSLVKGIISTIGSVVGKLIGLVVSAGKAIFNFVVGIYETMFDMANDYIQLILALQREKENIRESFGDTSKSVGKAVVDMGNQLFAGGAAGLAGMQLFESGVEAMVAAHELAKAGGAAFEKIIGQFSGTGINNIYAFQHGLGLTNEELGKMMSLSVTEDKQLEGMLANVEKYARGMSEAFGKTGGSFKSIARDMVRAKIDVKNFANVSEKDLAVAAQSARSLGVELHKLTGILDAFDQFDSAAENVSKLSQAFGLNLDTMELMNASTPTEQIDIIKRSFAAAGKSVENLDKRSLNYLATTLHLDPALVQQTMSTKNQGAAMGDLKTKAASVESQMISTTDALKDVMKDIKLFIREMTNDSKGFFATFFEGFAEGIVMNQRFKSSMMTMAQAIIDVKLAGRQAGDAFVEYFPGIKEMLEGLKTVMPVIGKLFQQYSKSISDFFKALREGGPSVGSLFGKLKGDTKQFFKDAGPGGAMFAEGATSFLSAVGRIFQEAVAALINSMTDMLQKAFITFGNWLEKGPSNTLITADGTAKSGSYLDLGGAVIKSLKESPIGQAFADMGKKLGPPMEKIINLLGAKIKKYFKAHKTEIAEAIAGILVLALGPMLLKLLIGYLARGGVSLATKALSSGGSAVASRAAATGASAVVAQGGTKVAEAVGTNLGGKFLTNAGQIITGGARKEAIKAIQVAHGIAKPAAAELFAKSAAAQLEASVAKVGTKVVEKGVETALVDGVTTASKTIASGGKLAAASSRLGSSFIGKMGPKMGIGAGLAISIGGSIAADMMYESGNPITGAVTSATTKLIANGLMFAPMMATGPVGLAAGALGAATFTLIQLALDDGFKNAVLGPKAIKVTSDALIEAEADQFEAIEHANELITARWKSMYATSEEERSAAAMEAHKKFLEVQKRLGGGEGGAAEGLAKSAKTSWVYTEGELDKGALPYLNKMSAQLSTLSAHTADEIDTLRQQQIDGAREHRSDMDIGGFFQDFDDNDLNTLTQGNIPKLQADIEQNRRDMDGLKNIQKMSPAEAKRTGTNISGIEGKIHEMEDNRNKLYADKETLKNLFSSDLNARMDAYTLFKTYFDDENKANIAIQALAAAQFKKAEPTNAYDGLKTKKDKLAHIAEQERIIKAKLAPSGAQPDWEKLARENEGYDPAHLAAGIEKMKSRYKISLDAQLAKNVERRKALGAEKEDPKDAERSAADSQAAVRKLLGDETTKFDVASVEAQFKKINDLNEKMGKNTGPLSVEALKVTLESIKTRLIGIKWDIIPESEVAGVTKAFDAISMLRGILYLMEGLGDSSVRAAASMRRFGSAALANTPAAILSRSSANLTSTVSLMGTGFASVATITADWKSNFLSMTLDDVRTKVDELATDSVAIAAGMNKYTAGVLSADPVGMQFAAATLVANLESFRAATANELGKVPNAKVVVSKGPEGIKGNYVHVISTTPLNLTLSVDVHMKTGDIENAIIKSGQSKIVTALREVADLAPKKGIVTASSAGEVTVTARP